MDKYELDGLDMDIEMFDNTYRAQYAALLKALSTRMRARNKLLISTVGAYFKDSEEADGMYDYDVIRDTCDLVTIILYDDHSARAYNSSSKATPGFVSHYEGIRRRLTYAVTRLGAEKTILSVATYGVDFNLDDHTAADITRQQVDVLLQTYGAIPASHDASIDDTWFSYLDDDGKRHEVYYDSDAALSRRLDYATQYGLAGVSYFYALSDTPALRQIIGDKLVDLPFRDVRRSWYYDSVRWAVNQGVTTGTSKAAFSPDATCTRGQVVTFLWRANGSTEPGNLRESFLDVKEGAFYYQAVAWAAEREITAGTSKNTFSPDAGCTRGQVVTFLWRAAGCPEPQIDADIFRDVKKNAYYYKAVAWAVENKITNGMDATHFGPDDTCTRAQIVTFLCRAMNSD